MQAHNGATWLVAAGVILWQLAVGGWQGRGTAFSDEPREGPSQRDAGTKDAAPPREWSTGQHSLVVGGIERSVWLDVPVDLQPGAPLVLVFHGYTDTAEKFRTTAGFVPLVNRHGFVAAYPQGTRDSKGNTFFNVGYAFHADSQVDDVALVATLKDQLVRDLKIDPRRVFATGMSNGGDMSYFLAAQPQPVVSAIAPVAGTMMTSWGERFVPASRLSVLHVHGTDDAVTRWAGDPENRDGWGAYLSVDNVLGKWTQGMKLETSNVHRLDARTQLHRWTTTADSTEVRLYRIEGGGHEWPNHLGDAQQVTAEVIWQFFQTHAD